jgi:ankyrin repeat protein
MACEMVVPGNVVFSAYIRQGADPNCTVDTGDTSFIWASEMGSAECVAVLLQYRADQTR